MRPVNRLQHVFEAKAECVLEERIMMRPSHVQVGEAAVIDRHAVILYDTKMELRSVPAPLSLVMNGESLPAATDCQGIPAESRDDLVGRGITGRGAHST